nr:CMF_HP1_G0046310.mRNA.1.CDS.1 [Saccharomyces cerevisiae]
MADICTSTKERKDAEAELVLQQRNRTRDPEKQIDSIDQFLETVKKSDQEIGSVVNKSRSHPC